MHYYSAMLMSREGRFTDLLLLPEMIKELETAIALDPGFADPYMILGFAQAYNGDRPKGLETMQKAVALNPRNEMYQFNLAQMYMNNQQFDQALSLLRGLEKTQNQQLATRAQESIAQAEQIKDLVRQGRVRIRIEPTPEAPDDAQTEDARPSPPALVRSGAASTARTNAQSTADSRPIQYIQGTIKAVDCSAPPSAVITVVTGTGRMLKAWKMKVGDIGQLTLRGADQFSCNWTQRKVGVNYRSSGDAEGDVVWLGLQ